MSSKQFHFLSPNTGSTGLPANRKALEAARSEARSHAAKVSYPPHHRVQRKATIRSGSEVSQDGTPEQYETVSEDGKSDLSSEISSPESATSLETTLSQGSAKGKPSMVPGGDDSIRPPLHPTPLTERASNIDDPSGSAPKTTETTKPMNTKFRAFVKKDRPKKSVAKKAQPPQDLSVKLPKSISKSTLDPFVRQALDLAVPDEHLLHLYLSTVPDELYGNSTGSSSDVARQGTLEVIGGNNIVLMWILLTLESQVVSFQPTEKDRQLSILSRRANAYQLMKEKVNEKNGSQLDFAFTVAVTASCEHRMGNPAAAEQHILAMKNLLNLQGGFQAVRRITNPQNLMVVNILVEQGFPRLFDYQEDVQMKLKATVDRLRIYQTWNYEMRFRGNNYAPANLDIDLTSDAREEEVSSSLEHLQMRARAFEKDSSLGKYVALPDEAVDDGQCRFLLSILYAMNTAFWDFRQNMRLSNAYLKEVATSAELSKAANFVLRAGGSKLPSLLMLMVIAQSAATAEGLDASTNVVFHDEEVFEFVNLIMMAGAESRQRVLRALSSWLTTDVLNMDDLPFISTREFGTLVQEVEDTWLSSQTRQLLEVGPV